MPSLADFRRWRSSPDRTLRALIAETDVLQTNGDLSVLLHGLTIDSRAVQAGDLFVACRGQKVDAHLFVGDAIGRGASAVVCEPPLPEGVSVPVVLVPDARRTLADLAGAWYGHPSDDFALVGVTGTDGKTTTTLLTAAILSAAGWKTGVISTVVVDRGHGEEPNQTSNTTPESLILQRYLADMRDAGCRAAVIEVSSHALMTHRVRGCSFDCAVFTNLDPEHLDFHGTLADYRAAKARLFAQLSESSAKPWGRLGVVNAADRASPAMRAASPVPCVDFGLKPSGQISGEILTTNLGGTEFRVRSMGGEETIRTSLVGRHNVLNWLGAIGAAGHFGATLADAKRAAATFPGVPGRLERVRCGQTFEVFVDFAHTPQALSATLSLLRQQVPGRLIVVFGQAGRRDAHNRPRMARAVAEYADLAILTNDDPYDDDPVRIVEDLAAALRQIGWKERRDFWITLDRREAIRFALACARRGDGVLLAGRGPEEITTIGTRRIPLSDAAVVRESLTGYRAA